jgi:hypothetical protein
MIAAIMKRTMVTKLEAVLGAFLMVPMRYYYFFYIALIEWLAYLKATVASFPALSRIRPSPPGWLGRYSVTSKTLSSTTIQQVF